MNPRTFNGIRPAPQLRVADDVPPLRLLLQPSGMAVGVPRRDSIIGRHSGADVRLPLPDVSRRHCRVVWGGSFWEVIDLQSLNGVWVNNVKVARAELHHGDLLRIGGFIFAVDLADDVDRTERCDGESMQRILHTLPRPEEGRRKAS
jgi:pSer/pThr/pTyr-binding forkhead associated (FHA) protein